LLLELLLLLLLFILLLAGTFFSRAIQYASLQTSTQSSQC